jgi:hypothetical protein
LTALWISGLCRIKTMPQFMPSTNGQLEHGCCMLSCEHHPLISFHYTTAREKSYVFVLWHAPRIVGSRADVEPAQVCCKQLSIGFGERDCRYTRLGCEAKPTHIQIMERMLQELRHRHDELYLPPFGLKTDPIACLIAQKPLPNPRRQICRLLRILCVNPHFDTRTSSSSYPFSPFVFKGQGVNDEQKQPNLLCSVKARFQRKFAFLQQWTAQLVFTGLHHRRLRQQEQHKCLSRQY